MMRSIDSSCQKETSEQRCFMNLCAVNDFQECMFDCVQPTRMARHGVAYTRRGSLNLSQARFTDDPQPLDPRCRCYTCRTHSRAYLRHLFTLKEHSYARLLTLHNLKFYADLMRVSRSKIAAGTYSAWWSKAYAQVGGVVE